MTITLHTTKGTPTFTTLRAACQWLDLYQPFGTSMTVNGRDVDYDFDAVSQFDTEALMSALESLVNDAAARGEKDDTLTPQELDGRWTVVDSSGQRFVPSDEAESADDALEAAEAGRGVWHY